MGFLGEDVYDNAAVIQQHPALAVVAFGTQGVAALDVSKRQVSSTAR